jgi:hypothetical protein
VGQLPEDEEEEFGFDEGSELEEHDLVVLRAGDGRELECVVLALIDREDASYALLTPNTGDEEEEGDLLVAQYWQDDDGVEHFVPLEDDSLLVEIQEALGNLISLGGEDQDLDGLLDD